MYIYWKERVETSFAVHRKVRKHNLCVCSVFDECWGQYTGQLTGLEWSLLQSCLFMWRLAIYNLIVSRLKYLTTFFVSVSNDVIDTENNVRGIASRQMYICDAINFIYYLPTLRGLFSPFGMKASVLPILFLFSRFCFF